MKKIFILFIAMTAIILGSNAQTVNDWKELKAFHTVMSETYHPAEEGNLKPIKTKSGELALKAEKMQVSLIPKEFNKPAIIAAVKKLASECKALTIGKEKGKRCNDPEKPQSTSQSLS